MSPESGTLTEIDKSSYLRLASLDSENREMTEVELIDSLRFLTHLLCKHYQQQVILLIDEYDVPLDKAQQYGYYDEMVMLIRNIFSKALKTNDNLYFAVMTGCLRISKESVFTGLNNLKVLSITNVRFDEYFGFTDEEVKMLLHQYELDSHYDEAKRWYDGYRFGKIDVYCPWDVLNYVETLLENPEAEPQAFWINTSENNIIRKFLQKSNATTLREIERLVNGECVEKKITQELTYKELYDNIDNIWSVLFTTGYLTQQGKQSGGMMKLIIPNLEIKKIFVEQIEEKQYAAKLQNDGMKDIVKYGIAFYRKKCKVEMNK